MLKLLLLLGTAWAVRDAAEQAIMEQEIMEQEEAARKTETTTDINMVVDTMHTGACTTFGQDYRVLKIVVKDTNMPSLYEHKFEFVVAEMKVKKQAHFETKLVGVPDSANLEVTAYMKQKYKWQALGYSKCGRKSAMITFPHDLGVHIEPFQKDSSAKFYQYISLTFQKDVSASRV
ncbi:unnamed protein product, partial [Effrenium voratum]